MVQNMVRILLVPRKNCLDQRNARKLYRGLIFGASDLCPSRSCAQSGKEQMPSSPPPNPSQDGANYGIRLSAKMAVEIYKEKLVKSEPKTFQASVQSLNARIRGRSVPLAIQYGVSPKTIRCACRWDSCKKAIHDCSTTTFAIPTRL